MGETSYVGIGLCIHLVRGHPVDKLNLKLAHRGAEDQGVLLVWPAG